MCNRATIAPLAAVAAAVAGVLGFCCGLPVLLSLGVLGAGAGLSMQNRALIGLGLVLAAFGWSRRAQRRRSADDMCGVSGPRTPRDPDTDKTPDTFTKGHDA
ncbi:MAG: hypothetical protein U5N53_12390 [Mycobacterium sp.]|nr:hypothetical protein [Mycobacterium sp.]